MDKMHIFHAHIVNIDIFSYIFSKNLGFSFLYLYILTEGSITQM
jgi:hypothetical protein